MLKSVTIAKDIAAPFEWQTFETDDVLGLLQEHFPTWPRAARIYHGTVSQASDVTPIDEGGADRLATLPGPFLVVVYPAGDPATWGLIISVVLSVASYVLAPKADVAPAATTRNSTAASPNNELSDRTNKARINGRIADIFGTVYSTPDLIAAPYKIFESNVEKEISYMCIGRGHYDVSSIKDGETLVSDISGASVVVYAPYTSPNSGTPQLQVGSAIADKVVRTTRSNSVTGQILRPPKDGVYVGDSDIYFVYPNMIKLRSYKANRELFSDVFTTDDVVAITNASVVGASPWSLNTTAGQVYLFKYFAPTEWQPLGYEEGVVYILLTNDYERVTLRAWLTANLQVGGMLDITQLNFTNEAGTGTNPSIDLSGTYEIDEVFVRPAWNYSAYLFFCIRLKDYATVNPDWNDFIASVDYGNWNLSFTLSGGGDGLSYDLAGTYTILGVSDDTLTLSSPGTVNSDWDLLSGPGQSSPLSPTLSISAAPRWVGPFTLSDKELQGLFLNFVAENGLYKDDGVTQYAVDVLLSVEVTPVDLSGDPIGNPQFFSITMNGSDSNKDAVNRTLDASLLFVGRCEVRVARITETDEEFEGTVTDEVKWRDLYSVAPISEENFGNVTTVHSVTYASASAMAVKERKLNMVVTRKLPARVGSTSEFTDETGLVATTSAADIFCAVCRDRYIGNRTLDELDVANIYDTIAEVEEYFGHANAVRFCHTFDSDNLSSSETMDAVASAVFCTAYRQGNVIRLRFEKETVDSTLLFNHRNKLPGTESRKIIFGTQGDYDGIEYTYTDPDDGSVLTIFLPDDYASTNPKKIETVGVSNHLQAYFGAHRAYNKLLYQNAVTEFEATEEADLLIRNDRILNADNTRPFTQDGDVLAVSTLELTLSQEVDLTEFADYVIWLQHTDGIAESISITAGSASNKVLLAQAPRLPLVTDGDKSARTAYVILGDEEAQLTAFLVDEREPQDRMTNTVKAVNYDARYYAHDKDFVDEVVDEDGLGIGGGYTPRPSGDTYTSPVGSGGALYNQVLYVPFSYVEGSVSAVSGAGSFEYDHGGSYLAVARPDAIVVFMAFRQAGSGEGDINASSLITYESPLSEAIDVNDDVAKEIVVGSAGFGTSICTMWVGISRVSGDFSTTTIEFDMNQPFTGDVKVVAFMMYNVDEIREMSFAGSTTLPFGDDGTSWTVPEKGAFVAGLMQYTDYTVPVTVVSNLDTGFEYTNLGTGEGAQYQIGNGHMYRVAYGLFPTSTAEQVGVAEAVDTTMRGGVGFVLSPTLEDIPAIYLSDHVITVTSESGFIAFNYMTSSQLENTPPGIDDGKLFVGLGSNGAFTFDGDSYGNTQLGITNEWVSDGNTAVNSDYQIKLEVIGGGRLPDYGTVNAWTAMEGAYYGWEITDAANELLQLRFSVRDVATQTVQAQSVHSITFIS